MFRSNSFKNCEVINIDTAERIGIVHDVEIDPETGNIKALVVKRHEGIFLSMFEREIVVPWSNIAVMGNEIILVRIVEIQGSNTSF